MNTDKPRGYAFIEYEHERDMHGMYEKNIIPLFSSQSVFIDPIHKWRPFSVCLVIVQISLASLTLEQEFISI